MVHEMLLQVGQFFKQIFIIIQEIKGYQVTMEKVKQVHRTFMVQILVENSQQVARLSEEKYYLEVLILLQTIKQGLKRHGQRKK
jgi:hypothetical protein